MNLLMKIVMAGCSGFLILACSMDVKKAYAPTAPPKVEKSNFAAAQIEGSFEAGTTLMFLWPEKIWNEEAQALVPMTFSQQAESRKNIVRYSEEKDIFEAKYIEAAQALEIKYTKIKSDLVEAYRDLKCYSYCDPDDFFCEPDNPDILFQDTWKPTEDPEELEIIAQCQANEKTRENIEEEKDLEAQEKVVPLREKAGEAAQNLLNAVGDRNFFNNLASFQLKYGKLKSCYVDNSGECLNINEGEKGLLIRVTFSGGGFSNAMGDDSLGDVTNIQFDTENGFLTFSIPALDFEKNNEQYGEIHFDLELNPKGDQLAVVGDIRLENYESGSTRIGRFSSSGQLLPMGAQ